MSSEDKTVRDGFLSTVVHQIATNDPPEAKETYDRLMAEGLSEGQALQLIGIVLKKEMKQMNEITTADLLEYGEACRSNHVQVAGLQVAHQLLHIGLAEHRGRLAHRDGTGAEALQPKPEAGKCLGMDGQPLGILLRQVDDLWQ